MAMLRIGLPRFGASLQLRTPVLQLCRGGSRPAAAAPRCIQTISLLDFQPPGLAPFSTRTCQLPFRPAAMVNSAGRLRMAPPLHEAGMLRTTRLLTCRPAAAAGPVAGRLFSTAPFPEDFSSIGSPETTSYLRNLHNGAEIYLVGTAHVSKASADEVRRLIRAVQPDTVLVELDAERAERLRNGKSASLFEFLRANLLGIFVPGSKWGASVVKFGVGGMYQVMRVMGLEPGGEFKAAIEEAHAVGARVVFGDRPVDVTSDRIAARVGFRDVLQLFFSSPQQPEAEQRPKGSASGASGGPQPENAPGLEGRVEALKTRQAATQMRDWMRKSNPQLAAVLVDERDQVVAVVGLAHLDGIEEKWRELDAA